MIEGRVLVGHMLPMIYYRIERYWDAPTSQIDVPGMIYYRIERFSVGGALQNILSYWDDLL